MVAPLIQDFLDFIGAAASPGVSAAGRARVYYDTVAGKILASINGAAYAALVRVGDALGGDLGATLLNPTVVAIEETGGPTRLAAGAIADGQNIKRSGAAYIGGITERILGGGDTVVPNATVTNVGPFTLNAGETFSLDVTVIDAAATQYYSMGTGAGAPFSGIWYLAYKGAAGDVSPEFYQVSGTNKTYRWLARAVKTS